MDWKLRKIHDVISPPFPPIFPHFPPFFLVAKGKMGIYHPFMRTPNFPRFPPFFLVIKRGGMGIARTSQDIPLPKVHFWGFWPKNFPFYHQKPIFAELPHFEDEVPVSGPFPLAETMA